MDLIQKVCTVEDAYLEETSAHSKAVILIVDDDEDIRRIIQEYLRKNGFYCKEVSGPDEALTIIDQNNIDMILTDIKMQNNDGIELMIEAHKDHPDISFIIMTGYALEYSYEDIIKAGANDFITKPFSMGELLAKILRIQREKKIINQLRQTLIKVKQLFHNTVGALASTLEKRDPYTAGHQHRVSKLAGAIAQEMGLAEERIEVLQLAALVHDIGKISVPAEVLAKPGKLSRNEMNLIKAHCRIGYEILKNVDFPWPIAEIVLQHHERLNGSGYPQGLVDQEILLEARIIAVADVVEAMSAHRPYRVALDLSKAIQEISQYRGILYDEKVVDSSLIILTEKGFNFRSN